GSSRMSAGTLLSPGLLHAVGVFLVGLGVLLVAAHASILALAGRRTSLTPSTGLVPPLLAAAVLGTWLAWAVLAVRDPVVVPEPAPVGLRTPQQPVLLFEMAGLFIVGIAALFTKTMRTLNAATPPEWLIGVQTYRVGGLIFLWPFLAAGAL